MSATFPQSQFRIVGADTAQQAAAIWRGALLDRFARLEALVLETLIKIPWKQTCTQAAYVSWQRFSILREAMADTRLAPGCKKTVSLLDQIDNLHELRNGLAHGIIKATRDGVTLNWQTWSDKAWVHRRIEYGWLEALEKLESTDKLRRDFASQMGQLRKLMNESI